MKKKIFGKLSAIGLSVLMAISATPLVASAETAPTELWKVKYSAITVESVSFWMGSGIDGELDEDQKKAVEDAFVYDTSFTGYFKSEQNAKSAISKIESNMKTAHSKAYSYAKSNGNTNSESTGSINYATELSTSKVDCEVTEVNGKVTSFKIGVDSIRIDGTSAGTVMWYYSDGGTQAITGMISSDTVPGATYTDYGFMIGQGTGSTGGSTGTTTPGVGGAFNPIPPVANRTPNATYVYKGVSYWYPNMQALLACGDSWTQQRATNYSDDRDYFDAITGLYYTSNPSSAYSYSISGETANYSDEFGSYKSANGKYYPSINEAKNESFAYNFTTTYKEIRDYSEYRYFNTETGKTYETKADAEDADEDGKIYDLSKYKKPSLNVNYFPYIPGLTYPGSSLPSTSVSTSWTSVDNYISRMYKGSTYTIPTKVLGTSNIIPQSTLATAKAKGVNLKFKLSGGQQWEIKAADIDTTKNLNVDIDYYCKSVSAALYNAALAANPTAVARSQFAIGTTGSLGLDASVTVRFNPKRAGYTAKYYKYDLSIPGLRLVDTARVDANGYCTLDINQGGEYIVVLIKN